ncbi:Glutaredoxin-related protein 5, mitochondrial [Porphyridium purpureum]|uniref:Uncharacterized monothiol glutaredoxin ycf64 n=1 Tax=Porphyridium purpureum TaxID=35688 RepID=A0A5J4YVJ1_PORPP|nr:Glutaredoxin-related protein 5, mitochondrial [Porphyridium purpureum]|eukprot:POR2040..scf209_3
MEFAVRSACRRALMPGGIHFALPRSSEGWKLASRQVATRPDWSRFMHAATPWRTSRGMARQQCCVGDGATPATQMKRALHAAPIARSPNQSGGVDEDSDADFQPKVKQPAGGGDAGGADIMDRIKGDVSTDKVVLYMKGLPSAPQCGFSLRTVQILKAIGVEFRAYNVLANPELREGIKRYSHWPTVPQLFVGGEFVGGCDIVEQMAQSGELLTMLKESGAKMPTEGSST